ncbi:hypothetical protein [Arhodomonas sp. SL1]|uniref:hypothetical protein n=1 Tax=Arhodomonas sp. SL1 TaxID=3425691 RepID=UPI003F881832
MKLLIVDLRRRPQPLTEALTASPLWRVVQCRDLPDAEAALAVTAFDYVLVDADDEATLAAANHRLRTLANGGPSRVVGMPAGSVVELPVGDGGARYGCRSGAAPERTRGDNPWVFEYHAPCRNTG